MTNVTSAPDTRHCNHTAGSCIVKLSNERGGIMEQSVIEIKNLVKRYKDLLALDHLNMEVRQGEVFGLLGPNGSGKTTAINCILGLLSYDKGEIRVFGKPMEADSYESKREIGVVMQNVAVFDELTVVENIDYFCGLYVRDKKERKRLVEEAVQFVELEEFSEVLPAKTFRRPVKTPQYRLRHCP